MSPEVLRVLKRDRALVTLKMRSGSARWATLVSATSPKLSGLSLEPQGAEGRGVFAIVATRAGRFDSLAFTASFTDALGMFRKTVSVKPGRFVAEVLPLSLLGQAARPMVSAVTWGETPAGMRGAGQEFYGAEEYTPSVESKDILWKRVAKEPERRIVSRIREVNVPRSIRVALVKSAGGDAASWMDSVSETIGRIGMSALEVGMGIEAVVPTNDGPVMLSAFDRRELAELVIGIWEEPALPETVDEGVASSDMLVVGSEALRKGSVMELTERVPSLVVPEGGPPPRLGMRARLLSEDSDVVNFLSMVIMR